MSPIVNRELMKCFVWGGDCAPIAVSCSTESTESLYVRGKGAKTDKKMGVFVLTFLA